MRIVSVQVGRARGRVDAAGRPYRTAFEKRAVSGAVRAGALGLEGDGQSDRRYHGGAEMAVLVFPFAHYAAWHAEESWPGLGPGGFGENLTVDGAEEREVCVGDVWRVGSATLQVSSPRTPCSKIERFWGRDGLLRRVEETGRTGFYLRVLEEGAVEAGAGIVLSERPHPGWTVARVLRAMRARRTELAEASAAARLEALSPAWRARLG